MIAKKRHFQTLPNDIPHHQRHIISDYVLVLTYLLYIYIYRYKQFRLEISRVINLSLFNIYSL